MRERFAPLLGRLGLAGGALIWLSSCVTPPPVEYRHDRVGLVIPLYIYPEDSRGRLPRAYEYVAKLARNHPELQIIAVLNPANGPGEARDPNYRRAVRRLSRAGVVLVGYVHWSYGAREQDEVMADVARWPQFYPGLTGIFIDEFPAVDRTGRWDREIEPPLAEIRAEATARELPLLIGNPGTPVPSFYLDSGLLDIVVLYEGATWPPPGALAGALAAGTAKAETASQTAGPAGGSRFAAPRGATAALIHGPGVWDPRRFTRLAAQVDYLFVNDFDRDMAGVRAYEWAHLPDNLQEQAELIRAAGAGR